MPNVRLLISSEGKRFAFMAGELGIAKAALDAVGSAFLEALVSPNALTVASRLEELNKARPSSLAPDAFESFCLALSAWTFARDEPDPEEALRILLVAAEVRGIAMERIHGKDATRRVMSSMGTRGADAMQQEHREWWLLSEQWMKAHLKDYEGRLSDAYKVLTTLAPMRYDTARKYVTRFRREQRAQRLQK